jgi:hypothetical protein
MIELLLTGTLFEDLNEHHAQGTPSIVASKKNTTRDLLTIFSDRIDVAFKKQKTGTVEMVEGRWCLLCK